MVRRILGIVMLLIAIIGVVLSIAGTYVVWSMIDSLGDGIDSTLELTSDSLDTVAESLLLSKSTVQNVTESVDTVEITTNNLSTTISETRPLIEQVSIVATSDVPDSLDTVQESLPNVAAVAGAIDDTLLILNGFQVNENILGFDVNFDLGIDYNPEIPFDESINGIGDSLDGVPERLRELEPFLNTTNDNLQVISDNINTLAGDLGEINEDIEDVQPLLDDYLEIVYDTNDLVGATQRGLRGQLQRVKTVVLVLFVWIGLTQIAPGYLGWELLSGNRQDVNEDQVEEAVRTAMEDIEEE